MCKELMLIAPKKCPPFENLQKVHCAIKKKGIEISFETVVLGNLALFFPDCEFEF